MQGADKVGTTEMIDIYSSLVKYGCKSRYYQNSLTAKGFASQTTNDETLQPTEPTIEDSDGYCESCAL